jgi:hypothetical protein
MADGYAAKSVPTGKVEGEKEEKTKENERSCTGKLKKQKKV